MNTWSGWLGVFEALIDAAESVEQIDASAASANRSAGTCPPASASSPWKTRPSCACPATMSCGYGCCSAPPGADELLLPTWNENEFLLAYGRRPTIRTFTPRRTDPHAGELDVEIVVHDGGAASDWAEAAAPAARRPSRA